MSSAKKRANATGGEESDAVRKLRELLGEADAAVARLANKTGAGASPYVSCSVLRRVW